MKKSIMEKKLEELRKGCNQVLYKTFSPFGKPYNCKEGFLCDSCEEKIKLLEGMY